MIIWIKNKKLQSILKKSNKTTIEVRVDIDIDEMKK